MAIKQVAEQTFYVGEVASKQKIFEGEIPLPDGMNYNSYLILDEKNCLLDTVDKRVEEEFLLNVKQALNGRKLDYLVVHHLEPDHTSGIMKIMSLHPETEMYISQMGLNFLKQFFEVPESILSRVKVVKEGDSLSLGKHKLSFITAMMVHWPEVIMSFDETTGVLFSADAFGSFGNYPLEKIYADEYDFHDDLLAENRRYYTNIVGKYGFQVLSTLAKANKLPIKAILPLHGPIYRENLEEIISKYQIWASYGKEEKGVLLICASIYGHTYEAAQLLEEKLKEEGVKAVLLSLDSSDWSQALSLSFVFDHIVLLSSTFNMGLFPKMEQYLDVYRDHQVKNRKFYFVENGTWAPQAGKLMKAILSGVPNNELDEGLITIHSSMKEPEALQLAALAKRIKTDLA